MDERSRLDGARSDGVQEGLERGRHQERARTARALLADGLSPERVARLLEISEADLEALLRAPAGPPEPE